MASLALTSAACATKATISSSPPGASVYAGDTKLGITPLEVSSENMKESVADGYLLRFEREGFHRLWVWVPDGVRGMNVILNMQPFAVTETMAAKAIPRAEIDAISARILGMQRDLLLKGAVDDESMQALLGEFPEVGAVHYLSAVNHLRKGDKSEALKSARLALKHSPGEPDYVVLYRELGGDPIVAASEASSGAQVPASVTKESEP